MLILDVWRKIYAWYGKRKTYKKYGLRTKHYFVGKRYDIGEYTYGIPTVHVYDDTAKLKIGKFCSLAGGVEIVLGGNHHIDWCSTFSFYEAKEYLSEWQKLNLPQSRSKGDVVIGNDVWIGRNALLLSGAQIGDGAVIGAGAVVAGKIPPYAIAVGNPAKVIRFRLPPPQLVNKC